MKVLHIPFVLRLEEFTLIYHSPLVTNSNVKVNRRRWTFHDEQPTHCRGLLRLLVYLFVLCVNLDYDTLKFD